MSRTRADFMLEYRRALDEVPVSLTKLLSISEHAVVDLRDATTSDSKLDCPLASCCDDMRVVNACERHLKVMTIGDLSRIGCDRLLAVRNLGRKGFVAIHDAVSKELGDHLLSRDLDQECLNLVLAASLILRGDLRRKTHSWFRWAFASPEFAEYLISLRGMSGIEEDDQDGEDDLDDEEKPLSRKIQEHLDRLNKLAPNKDPQDD